MYTLILQIIGTFLFAILIASNVAPDFSADGQTFLKSHEGLKNRGKRLFSLLIKIGLLTTAFLGFKFSNEVYKTAHFLYEKSSVYVSYFFDKKEKVENKPIINQKKTSKISKSETKIFIIKYTVLTALTLTLSCLYFYEKLDKTYIYTFVFLTLIGLFLFDFLNLKFINNEKNRD